jgi:hypothetical protein
MAAFFLDGGEGVPLLYDGALVVVGGEVVV